MKRFELGSVYMTRGVNALCKDNQECIDTINKVFNRYIHKDWGEMSEQDKELNDEAIEIGERIFASYETKFGKIWIITEWDRSATTILLPEEY